MPPTTDVARMVKFFEGSSLDVARSDLTLTMKHPSVAQSTPNRFSFLRPVKMAKRRGNGEVNWPNLTLATFTF